MYFIDENQISSWWNKLQQKPGELIHTQGRILSVLVLLLDLATSMKKKSICDTNILKLGKEKNLCYLFQESRHIWKYSYSCIFILMKFLIGHTYSSRSMCFIHRPNRGVEQECRKTLSAFDGITDLGCLSRNVRLLLFHCFDREWKFSQLPFDIFCCKCPQSRGQRSNMEIQSLSMSLLIRLSRNEEINRIFLRTHQAYL